MTPASRACHCRRRCQTATTSGGSKLILSAGKERGLISPPAAILAPGCSELLTRDSSLVPTSKKVQLGKKKVWLKFLGTDSCFLSAVPCGSFAD